MATAAGSVIFDGQTFRANTLEDAFLQAAHGFPLAESDAFFDDPTLWGRTLLDKLKPHKALWQAAGSALGKLLLSSEPAEYALARDLQSSHGVIEIPTVIKCVQQLCGEEDPDIHAEAGRLCACFSAEEKKKVLVALEPTLARLPGELAAQLRQTLAPGEGLPPASA